MVKTLTKGLTYLLVYHLLLIQVGHLYAGAGEVKRLGFYYTRLYRPTFYPYVINKRPSCNYSFFTINTYIFSDLLSLLPSRSSSSLEKIPCLEKNFQTWKKISKLGNKFPNMEINFHAWKFQMYRLNEWKFS